MASTIIKRLEKIKQRLEASKLRLEIIVLLIAITTAAIAFIDWFYPLKRTAGARIQIVEYIVDNTGDNPKLKVKLSNTGGSPAYIKRAELVFSELKVTKEPGHASSEVKPVLHNWLLSTGQKLAKPLKRKSFQQAVLIA